MAYEMLNSVSQSEIIKRSCPPVRKKKRKGGKKQDSGELHSYLFSYIKK